MRRRTRGARKKLRTPSPRALNIRLQSFAAPALETTDKTQVQNGQLGDMVTLGAYAICKVDADIAPIAVGDLLTTSPTKVIPEGAGARKSVGAIIGKALGSLKAGQGQIPVLVCSIKRQG